MSRYSCRHTNSTADYMNNQSTKAEDWTFFSNNAHVLVCLSHAPQPTTREIASQVGITERAVQRIIKRLMEADVLKIEKIGRRNRYELNLDQQLRHPLESHKTIGEFIHLIDSQGQTAE
jgi:DNA-binding MarR family transcriptional regulator